MIKNNHLGTLASKILDIELYENQNVVKVITKENLNILKFPNSNKFYAKIATNKKIFTII